MNKQYYRIKKSLNSTTEAGVLGDMYIDGVFTIQHQASMWAKFRQEHDALYCTDATYTVVPVDKQTAMKGPHNCPPEAAPPTMRRPDRLQDMVEPIDPTWPKVGTSACCARAEANRCLDTILATERIRRSALKRHPMGQAHSNGRN